MNLEYFDIDTDRCRVHYKALSEKLILMFHDVLESTLTCTLDSSLSEQSCMFIYKLLTHTSTSLRLNVRVIFSSPVPVILDD